MRAQVATSRCLAISRLKIRRAVTQEQNAMFDVILYTRGNEVFARQRVGNGGRYRFNNVFNGDYYLAVELDSMEVARMPILISANAVEHIRQDLEFRWKGARNAAGVVSVADNYDRTSKNRSLYERAKKEIGGKNLTQAMRRFVPWSSQIPKTFRPGRISAWPISSRKISKRRKPATARRSKQNRITSRRW